MRHFLLFHSSTSETGKNLLESLRETGIDIDGGTSATDRYGVLVRWGSQAKVELRPEKVINSLMSIRRASNKLDALIALGGSVHVPRIIKQEEFKPNFGDYPFPLLARKATHSGGTDIELCLQESDMAKAIDNGCNHFVEYIPTTAEYRVHVFDGDVIKVSQKILTDQEKYKCNWVRNFDNGFTFHNPHLRPRHGHLGIAVDAVELLGLNFGAVDLIVADNSQAYILEVNTAPGLKADSSLEVYTERIAEAIRTHDAKVAS